MSDLDLSDIQGLILRGYHMPHLRIFALRIDDAPGARRFIGGLIGGDTDAPGPHITTAAPWPVKPAFTVNIGFTHEGLKALGLPDASLKSFPEEFVEGAAARVGDTGDSAPERWTGKLASAEAHMLLMVFAESRAAREEATGALRLRWEPGGAATELSRHDGDVLDGNLLHFGYRDNYSQPTIADAPPAGLPDPLPRPPLGAFLLGYPSQNPGFVYPVPEPQSLGFNGSFIALRILQQDVAGFERFLHETAPRIGMSEELLAAKICGRWRSGVPLSLSPETDTPDPPIPPEKMNYFDYVPTDACPDAFDDRRGYRCPIGSHIRRGYPRSGRTAGNGGHLHRIVRRGLPYGPPFDPSRPDDGIERGLLGVFLCVSLKDQFEFLMKEWVNDGTFAPGLGRTRDPLCGDNTREASKFVIPSPEGAVVVTGFSRFVTTRGGAYGFLPGVTALRRLANLQGHLPARR